MTLEEVGSALKAERERKGIRIEDVANQLKLAPRLILALETGNNAALPHQAYVRGFVRSYAGLLGIGQEEVQHWMTKLDTSSAPGKSNASGTLAAESRRDGTAKSAPHISRPAEPDPKKPEFRKSEPKPEAATEKPVSKMPPLPAATKPDKESLDMGDGATQPLPRQKKRGWGIFLLLFALCALGGGGWWVWQNGYLEISQPPEPQTVALDQRLPRADTYLAEKEASRQSEETQQQARNEQSPQASVAADAAPKDNKTTSAPASDLALPPADIPQQAKPAAETAPQKASESHKLIITAVEECWVHSNADKTDTRQFSLRKGDTFALTFNKSLELKLGNAGGVRLRYDGEDLPPPGTSGQVRTITFPQTDDGRR